MPTYSYNQLSEIQGISSSTIPDCTCATGFGWDVSLNSTTKNIIASIPCINLDHTRQGQVLVLGTSSNWPINKQYTTIQYLTCSEHVGDNEEFGKRIKFSNVTNMIYSSKGIQTDICRMYSFTQSGPYWHQHQIITATYGGIHRNFACSAEISPNYSSVAGVNMENYLIIGESAYESDDFGIPGVYVFIPHPTSPYTWRQLQRITSSCIFDATRSEFGNNVFINKNDYIIAGAPSEDRDGASMHRQGCAYVFKNIGGLFYQCARLIASDRANNDCFGASIACNDDDTITIGAAAATIGANALQGAAYIFTKTGPDQWTQYQKLTASDGAFGSRFGCGQDFWGDNQLAHRNSIKMFNDQKKTIIIGSQGSDVVDKMYIFTQSGPYWHQHQTLTCSHAAFGAAATLECLDGIVNGDSNDFLIVGGYNDNVNYGAWIYSNLYNINYNYAPPCVYPAIDSNFTLNNLYCLPNQYTNTTGERVYTVPSLLNTPGMSLRNRKTPLSSSIQFQDTKFITIPKKFQTGSF